MKKAQNIHLLILDVDGVLTNGTIVYTDAGEEYKCFNTQDGLGIRLLLQEGIRVALISGRTSKAVSSRAEDLGITDVYQGSGDKVAVFKKLQKKTIIVPEQVCFVGDDLVDLPLLTQVGFAVAVANAVQDVKQHADYITTSPGGRGAVREVCELILKAQGKWEHCLSRYLFSHGSVGQP